MASFNPLGEAAMSLRASRSWFRLAGDSLNPHKNDKGRAFRLAGDCTNHPEHHCEGGQQRRVANTSNTSSPFFAVHGASMGVRGELTTTPDFPPKKHTCYVWLVPVSR